MIVFAAFQKKISYDWPTVVSLISIAGIFAATMPALEEMKYLCPLVLAIVAAISGVQRYQDGSFPRTDWRVLARAADQIIPKNEPLIFIGHGSVGPEFGCVVFTHYVPDSTRPVMIVSDSVAPDQIQALARYGRIWIYGGDERDSQSWLAGWREENESPGTKAVFTPMIPPLPTTIPATQL
jgi:hypothetical protein